MSSPGDYLAVRAGAAFGIAPCGKLWAKELCGVPCRACVVCASIFIQLVCTKWSFAPLNCPKNSLRGPEEKTVFIAKGESVFFLTSARNSKFEPDLRSRPCTWHKVLLWAKPWWRPGGPKPWPKAPPRFGGALVVPWSMESHQGLSVCCIINTTYIYAVPLLGNLDPKDRHHSVYGRCRVGNNQPT